MRQLDLPLSVPPCEAHGRDRVPMIGRAAAKATSALRCAPASLSASVPASIPATIPASAAAVSIAPESLARAQLKVQSTQFLWLSVTLSGRLNTAQVVQWHQSLQAYLAGHGLMAAISPAHIVVLPKGRPLTLSDRGAVLAWLVAQPSVVVVKIERHGGLPDLQLSGSGL